MYEFQRQNYDRLLFLLCELETWKIQEKKKLGNK